MTENRNLTDRPTADKTLSSLELLEFINRVRDEEGGRRPLRHDHLMTKIQKEFGEVAPKFRGYYVAENGKENPCYFLPEREACIVVMSESPKVRAMIYDRMRELEANISNRYSEGQEWLTRLLKEQRELTEMMSGNIVILGSDVNALTKKVENVRSDISEIKDRITILETRRPRREIKDSVKADHYTCLQRMGWRCPINHEPISPSDVEFDHFFNNQLPDFKHTWPLSRSAHSLLTTGRMSRVEARAAFDAYQSFADRVMPKQLGLL